MFRCGGGFVHTTSWWVALCIRDFENQLNLLQETGNHDEIHVKVWAKFVKERSWELELYFVLGNYCIEQNVAEKGCTGVDLRLQVGEGVKFLGLFADVMATALRQRFGAVLLPLKHTHPSSTIAKRFMGGHGHDDAGDTFLEFLTTIHILSILEYLVLVVDAVVYFLWFYVFRVRRNEVCWWQPQPQLIFPCPTTIQGVVRSSCDDGCGLLSLILFLKDKER